MVIDQDILNHLFISLLFFFIILLIFRVTSDRKVHKVISVIFLTTSSLFVFPKVALAKSASIQDVTTTSDPWIVTDTKNNKQYLNYSPQVQVETKSQTYTIKSGDNLWMISKMFETKPEQVRNYWLKIIEENRNNLKSKNPNLIYPNEVINLPED